MRLRLMIRRGLALVNRRWLMGRLLRFGDRSPMSLRLLVNCALRVIRRGSRRTLVLLWLLVRYRLRLTWLVVTFMLLCLLSRLRHIRKLRLIRIRVLI